MMKRFHNSLIELMLKKRATDAKQLKMDEYPEELLI